MGGGGGREGIEVRNVTKCYQCTSPWYFIKFFEACKFIFDIFGSAALNKYRLNYLEDWNQLGNMLTRSLHQEPLHQVISSG
jgi:hypothetical protein